MSVQRMLKPIANRIVGSAIHVVGGKSSTVTPRFKIARGIVRRGPRAIKTTKGLLFVSDPLIKGYFVFRDGESLGYVREHNDIYKMKAPRKVKKKIWETIKEIAMGSKPNIRTGGKHATRTITHPARQFAQRAAIAAATAGTATAGGAALGHNIGQKKGYGKGYETALQDVLRYSKSVHGDMNKIMNDLQNNGITLTDLRKMSMEELQDKIKKGVGYKFARDIGEVARQKYVATPYKRFKTTVKVGREVSGNIDRDDKDKKPTKRPVHKVISAVPVSGVQLKREDLHGGRRKKKMHKVMNPETQGDTLKKTFATSASRAFIGAPKAPGIGTGLKNVYRKGQLQIRRKLRSGMQSAKQKMKQHKGATAAIATFGVGSTVLSRSKNRDVSGQYNQNQYGGY